VPLGPRDLSYDRAAHTFVVRRDLPLGVGPDEVAEIGVIGGDGEDRPNTGYVLTRVVPAAPVDRTRPVPLRVEIAVPLVGRLDVAVPDVEGRRVDTARTRLARAGLAVVVSDGGEVPPVDVGKVLAQHPVADAVVPEGTPVTIEVGRARMVPVPSVVGLVPDEATAVLTAALLTVSADAPTRVSDRPEGVVDDTAPPPGTVVAEGTTVTMVRAEARKVPVPDGRGLLLGEARRLLVEAGLVPGPDPAPSTGSSGTPGSVVAQAPEAGDEVPVGSTVVLTVAAPWTVAVPDLAGRPLDELQQLLVDATAERVASLGLPVGTRALGLGRIDRRPSDRPAGTVIDQSPAAGEEAFLYGTVDVVAAAEALVVVPDLSGLDQTSAAGALAAVGLMLGTLDTKSSARVSGVLGQKPVAGARVPPGSAVAVTVAVSPRVTVPDVVGSVAAVANEIIVSAGLAVGLPVLETPPAGEPVAPGTVLAQAPVAGTSVDVGSAVQFTIAAGVPGVVGLTVDDARRELEAAGLAMTVTERPSEATPGVIVAQDPPAGSAAPAGATVIVVVTVAARVRVPDLTDLDAGRARRELSDAGLVLAGLTSEESDRPEGRVISQEPAAGTTAARGSGVIVVLAAARAATADVPDVVGRRVDEARDRLVADGFALGKISREPHRADPDTVIAQDPPAGTAVPVGSVVHLTVSSADAVVVVPDLRDRTLEVAVELGRSVGVEVVGPVDVDPAAVVVTRQRPLPGGRVPFGTTVMVQVAELVEVPEVLGRTGDEAAELLRRLGFIVTVTTQLAVFARMGTVIAQEPTAGTLVAAGSTVALIVAGRPVLRDDLIIEGGRLGRPDPIGPVVNPVINPVIDPGGELRPINPFRSGPN
jgi:beta-lactam-binding protein with PASTA domain